jgi:hypothetical protein
MTIGALARRDPMIHPSGEDSLVVREAYLHDRRTRGLTDRGITALWVLLGAVVGWLFIAGFTGLGH